MANYQLEQTGAEVQAILNAVQSPDTTPVAGSSKLITSGGVQAALAGAAAEVGALTDLDTTDKSSIVAAVNELEAGKADQSEVTALGHEVDGLEADASAIFTDESIQVAAATADVGGILQDGTYDSYSAYRHFSVNLEGKGISAISFTKTYVNNGGVTRDCYGFIDENDAWVGYPGTAGTKDNVTVYVPSGAKEFRVAWNLNQVNNFPITFRKLSLGLSQNEQFQKLNQDVNGFEFSDAFTIPSSGEHSSNNDRISFENPLLPGEYYFLVSSGTTGNEGICQLFVRYVGESSSLSLGAQTIGQPLKATIANPVESIGIYMSASVNQSAGTMPLTIWQESIIDYITGPADKSVIFYNTDKDSAIISAASRSPLSYGYQNSQLCPVFSVLTDLHSDLARFERACEYADNESAVLATFCLGDLIDTSKSANPYPLILNYAKPVISITGNHEVLKITAQSVTGWSETDIMNNMYSPAQVAHNGENHPSGKCYWYKDFIKTIDGSAKTLRVIGLHQYEGGGTGDAGTGAGKDVCYYTQEQIDWLIERLDEVDGNTWVMILVHYAPTANLERIECPFTPSESFNFPLQGGSNTGGSSSMSDDEFLPKILQAWIDGTTLNESCVITMGGTTTTITAIKNTPFAAHPHKFAGWFSGHTHRDFVGKLENYPDQLQFSFICTGAVSVQQSCDIGRNTNGKSQDCFTIVGIDWFKNSVSLVRVGADTTTDMRRRDFYNILF